MEPRHLHLLGATAKSRTVVEGGKEWLVVPVVALMEGVIHAVNASTPEFVPEATLRKAAASWEGKPVTLGHPRGTGGKACSASEAGVAEAVGLGVVRNPRMEGKKLLCEAWVEKARAKKLAPALLADLAADKVVEVSVGAFVIADGVAGEYGGKPHKGSWLDAGGDHLALLPGSRGACSVAMGCGTARAAMHFVAAESIELIPGRGAVLAVTALEGESLDDRMRAVDQACRDKYKRTVEQSYPDAYLVQVFDDRVVLRKGDGSTVQVSYEMKDGKAVLGDDEKPVRQQWVEAAAAKDCETCEGTGQVKDGDSQKDCPHCGGSGEWKPRAAQAARPAAADDPTRFYIDRVRRESARTAAAQ